MVIPKALRERAGLAPGTQIDFHFHDGSIEITPLVPETDWEVHRGIEFPIPAPGAPGMTKEEVREVIEDVRGDRADAVTRAGS